MDGRHTDEYYGARIAPVAQLDRVLPSEGSGRGFESRLVHHLLSLVLQGIALLTKTCPGPESRFCQKFSTLERGGNGRNGNHQESRRVSVVSADPSQGLSSPTQNLRNQIRRRSSLGTNDRKPPF